MDLVVLGLYGLRQAEVDRARTCRHGLHHTRRDLRRDAGAAKQEESGLRGFDVDGWVALAAPATVPRPILILSAG